VTRLQTAANGHELVERAQDIRFVIDELERRNRTDGRLKGQLNLDEIAITGHSFGAGTSLVIAGETVTGRLSLADKRVKSAIYLCPPVMGQHSGIDNVYANILIPGLLLTGTEDNSPIGRTTASERRIPFDRIHAPHQYLVNFYGANHMTFSGRTVGESEAADAEFHKMIEKVTAEFLDATLMHDASAWHWLDSKEVSDYLGKTAEYERK